MELEEETEVGSPHLLSLLNPDSCQGLASAIDHHDAALHQQQQTRMQPSNSLITSFNGGLDQEEGSCSAMDYSGAAADHHNHHPHYHHYDHHHGHDHGHHPPHHYHHPHHVSNIPPAMHPNLVSTLKLMLTSPPSSPSQLSAQSLINYMQKASRPPLQPTTLLQIPTRSCDHRGPSMMIKDSTIFSLDDKENIREGIMHAAPLSVLHHINQPPSAINPTHNHLLPPPPHVSFSPNDADDDEVEANTVPLDLIHNRRPFACSYPGCNKTFKNPQTLRMHYKTHGCTQAAGGDQEAGKNPISIEAMLQRSSSLPSYFTSMAAMANSNYYNGNPSNSSPSSTNMKVGAGGHNKKVPSRCPLCKKTFVGLYELRRHFGRKHSEGEKMHGCKKCGKKFYIEVDLRDHEKLCGEPILCKCGMRFAFKCNLVAHKKAHPECS